MATFRHCKDTPTAEATSMIVSGQLQAPAPLQVAAPAHSLAGSCPLGTLEQVPVMPATLHALQTPGQAESQHTPSVQAPLAHSAPLAQGVPSPLKQALEPLQLSAPAHSF